jgi:predicted esterase
MSIEASGKATIGRFWAALFVLSGSCSAEEKSTMPVTSTGGTGVATAGAFSTAGRAAAGTAGLGIAGTGILPGGIAGTTGVGVTAGTSAAGTGTTGGLAGTGVPAGRGASGAPSAGAGTAGMMAGAAGSTMIPTPTGASPTLPAIAGTCPEFRNGSTIMVAGHGSIAIAAGEKGKGGPLLFYWHGTGGSSAEAMRTIPAAVRQEIIGAGGIIAAFDGNQSSGSAGDCSGTAAHNIADFNAADQIAACAVMMHGVDARRIYSTGCSAGGLQTGCMAILRSSYIAAAAPNSGGIIGRRAWQDMHSPAIFTMHGGPNDVVGVAFSDTSASLDMLAKTHGSFVVNCNHGGSHCGAGQPLQTAAWQFMKDHPWGVTPSPWAAAIPAGIPDYCKIF